MTDRKVNKGEDASSVSTSLLDRIKLRDPAAWARMVDLFTPLVYGWCRMARLQKADAAEVGQEVFKAVYRSVGRFRRDRPGDTFGGWLRTITQNKLRDFIKRKRARVDDPIGGSKAKHELQQIPSEEDVETAVAPRPNEHEALSQRAILMIRNEFNDRDWQAFWRVTVDLQATSDVARDLNMTLNMVYLAKSRILARFRAEFAELLEETRNPKSEIPNPN